MNVKTAKLINRYARLFKIQPRDLRRKFLLLPEEKRVQSIHSMIVTLENVKQIKHAKTP